MTVDQAISDVSRLHIQPGRLLVRAIMQDCQEGIVGSTLVTMLYLQVKLTEATANAIDGMQAIG